MEFTISSDLSITNTKLSIDSKDITKKQKIVGINFWASSPSKDDCDCTGYIDLSVTMIDDDGTVETKSYRKSEYESKKLPMGQVIKDHLETVDSANFIRLLGTNVDTEIKDLADKIADHCKDKELKCPDKDVLYSRTKQSLVDKADDLGIVLDTEADTEPESDEEEGTEATDKKKCKKKK